MTSYFTLIACKVISWMSCQQKIVALSSTEAEYIALSLIVAVSLSGQETFLMRSVLMFQLFISMVRILAHFFGDLTLYKKSAPNILIFAITT